jgi:hypothetical protein
MAGDLTISQLETEVAKNLGGRDVANPRIRTFLDFAQMRMARAYDFNDLEHVITEVIVPTAVLATDKMVAMPGKIRDIYTVLVSTDTITVTATTTVTVDAASGATTITVADASGFSQSDAITIYLDSGLSMANSIDGIATNVLTLSTALTDNVSNGQGVVKGLSNPDPDTKKLVRVGLRQWDHLMPAAEESSPGEPTHYARYRNHLELWRVPNVTYIMKRRQTVWPPLFVDGAVSKFDNKDDIIVAAATSWGFQSLGQREEGGTWFTMYKDLFADAVVEDGQEADLLIVPRGISEEEGALTTDPVADPFVKRTIF